METKESLSLPEAAKIVGIHLLLFFGATALFYFIHPSTAELSSIKYWDITWYKSIVKKGYVFSEAGQSNTAFFPLFPYVWRWLHLKGMGISLVNLLCFLSGLYVLVRNFNPDRRALQLFLSIPVLFFFMVPYSESFFFLFCSIFLAGFHRKNNYMILTGLFLAALTRSAASIFLPAFLLMGIYIFERRNLKQSIIMVVLSLIIILTATGLVIYIQYYQTGVWFAAAKSQLQWHHYMRLPELPFKSWGGSEARKLDGGATLVGFTCMYWLAVWLYKRFAGQDYQKQTTVIFSFLYMAGVTASLILFQGGSLYSLNRYVFATPFFFMFVLYFRNREFATKTIIALFIFLNIYWLLFYSYQSIQSFLDYVLFSAYMAGYLLIGHAHKKVSAVSFYAVYSINIILQAYLFIRFMDNKWVG